MKYFNQKRFILFVIFIILVKLSSQNDQKQLERFKNSIYLLISRTKGIINNTSFIFEYEKYNITLVNFFILKPFSKNLTINKEKNENNETILNLNNIAVTIKADIIIKLLARKDEQIYYNSIFFELYFNEIKFKLINNFYIEFYSSNIESFIYNNLENLSIFSEFNEKKICIFYEEEKEPIMLEEYDSKLKEIFREKFEEKIIDRQKYFNLLTYDLIHILDNYPYYFESNAFYYIMELFIKKFNVEENDINLNIENNSISINYFKLNGKYLYSGFTNLYFDFNITCYLNGEHFNFKRNNNETYIKFSLKDCVIKDNNYDFETYTEDYDEEIRTIIENYYINYLKNITNIYYNDIL
jgi:hypothetical protein